VKAVESDDWAPFPEPPADPEEWTDEEWLAWLRATDADEAGGASESPPTTRGARIVESPSGHLLGEAMLGLAHAIYGRQVDEVVIVAAGDSEPGDDEPFIVHLDPDHPERSTVVFRPPDPGAG